MVSSPVAIPIKFVLPCVALAALLIGLLPALQSPELVQIPEMTTSSAVIPSIGKNVHLVLPDDVMITMRVSKFFLAHGYPGFNASDRAQPATSYLWPLLVAPAFHFLSDNAALATVALLGALCILGSSYIALRAHSRLDLTALLFMAILCLNGTTLSYLYSGWEHLPQALLCCLCCFLAIERRDHWSSAVCFGAICALAILMRIDSVWLIAPLAMTYVIGVRRPAALVAMVSGVAIIGVYFTFQWHWFHHIFPTTARLKANYVVAPRYQFAYWEWAIRNGTAATFIPLVIAANWRLLATANLAVKAAIVGVSVDYVYAYVVSDVFAGARMYLPALGVAVVAIASIDASKRSEPSELVKRATPIAYAAAFALSIGGILLQSYEKRVVDPIVNSSSPVAQQLAVAEFIRASFSPQDGSVGAFYLGTVSFALTDYEVADFLGKADEQIASLQPKPGPPGHNKWNIDMTLQKWNPAAIVFPIQTLSLAEIRERLGRHESFAFWDDAASSESIRGRYQFCIPYARLSWGILVRNDLVRKVSSSCWSIAPAAAL